MNKQNGGGERAAPYKIITVVLSALLALMTLCFALAVHTNTIHDLGDPMTAGSGGGLVLDEHGDELDGGEVHNMPSGMTFRSASALGDAEEYASITLHATIKPETAENKAVDWNVEFEDPDSEWATGKNAAEYVSVTPQSDGSATATAQCLQPFGERIKIIVSSREFPAKKAACVLDFAQRITDITLRANKGGDAPAENWVSIKASERFYRSADAKPFYALEEVIFEYTAYTTEDNFQKEYEITGSEEMLGKLKAGGLTNAALTSVKGSWTTSFMDSVLMNRWAFKGFVTTPNYYNLTKDDLNTALSIARENLEVPTSVIKFSFTGAYSSASFEIGFLTSLEGLGFGIESIELDRTHVVV